MFALGRFGASSRVRPVRSLKSSRTISVGALLNLSRSGVSAVARPLLSPVGAAAAGGDGLPPLGKGAGVGLGPEGGITPGAGVNPGTEAGVRPSPEGGVRPSPEGGVGPGPPGGVIPGPVGEGIAPNPGGGIMPEGGPIGRWADTIPAQSAKAMNRAVQWRLPREIRLTFDRSFIMGLPMVLCRHLPPASLRTRSTG